MMKSIPIIVILVGIVFIGITIQNLIKSGASEDQTEKAELKKISIVFLVLAVVSIVVGIVLIKII